ncbi:ferredoxin-thioredoxin reductase catalytic domain-containing protein [Candidatus Poribacteria bacterium]
MRSMKEIAAELVVDAERGGYTLNPDQEILDGIVEGLAINEGKLGYWSCPCRIASGDRVADFDTICPCEYRDPDLEEYGRCYCALYVTQDYIDAGMPADPIPERRPESRQNRGAEMDTVEETQDTEDSADTVGGEIKVWRCQVCGYLCARTAAPRICPICRAKQERFEEFHL